MLASRQLILARTTFRLQGHVLWRGPCALAAAAPRLRGSARFRALELRERDGLRCESREAAPRRRSEH
jgi:hypothetical protein